MFFMKTVSLMWDYDNGFFPNWFNNYFPHTRTICHHEARFDMNQTAFQMLPLMSLTKLEVNKKSYEVESERHSV